MTNPQPLTGARHIAETLHGYGVTHVFYVDAMLRKTMVDLEALGVRRIITHSEKAAAYMADGYARVSGRVGVCLAQAVGAANLASGLQDPYLAKTPVIALTGKKPPLFQNRNAYQEIHHWPLFAPVTKYQADVIAPAQLPLLLRQAFREATSGQPGPVHLDLAGRAGRDIEAALGLPPVTIDARFAQCPPFRPEPDAASIASAARAIVSAQRPVIVAGGGVRLSGAADEIRALAEKRGIPVATSVNGKGSLAENHPLSVSVVGDYSAHCANRVVHEADLVIFVGSGTGDQTTLDWSLPRPGTRIVQIDIDPRELGRNYPNTLGVAADAKVALQSLVAQLAPSAGNAAWLNRVGQIVSEWKAEIEPLRQSNETPIRPERLCKELAEALPHDAVLVSDTGYAAIWTATMVPFTQPTQTYLRAAGSLGWAFPASLGAKCAVPARPVLCFTGDGGFWYHLSELETARRYGIHTVTIVNNNDGLSQGIEDVHAMYGQRPGDPGELYRFSAVNFADVARALGCVGLRVEKPEEIAPALREALATNAPVVVDVHTHFSARAPKPWMPKP